MAFFCRWAWTILLMPIDSSADAMGSSVDGIGNSKTLIFYDKGVNKDYGIHNHTTDDSALPDH